jgi:Mn-dependent DtxR family transcriptional regulator
MLESIYSKQHYAVITVLAASPARMFVHGVFPNTISGSHNKLKRKGYREYLDHRSMTVEASRDYTADERYV